MLERYEPEALASAGIVITADGTPYPPMPSPPYRPIASRSWQFDSFILAAAPGYFTGPRILTWDTFALSREGITWMSLVPMEVESQMPHLAAAHGTVVVCGLGLGLMAYAVSALKSVERVVVVERDPEVMAMFRDFAAFDAWPQRAKVELVLEDACEYRNTDSDFLYADIWPFYRMERTIPEMQRMHRNIPSPSCGYWGQELDMVDEAVARGVALDAFSAADVEAFRATHNLPLIGLEEPTYPALCRQAARNPAITPR
jgi:hypothetical protein